jgi:uroporphyrinogen-III synthase
MKSVFPLADTVVLVTRPAHQAQPLCALIEAEGGRAIAFPVLEIQDLPDNSAVVRLVERLDEFDIAIFISANAVTKAMDLILPRRDWPSHLQIAVVGARTAGALQEYGVMVDICPEEKFNSEALLALPEMCAIKNKKVVIFRGEGGRELLADTLRQRGADIEYAEVYRRSKPVDMPGYTSLNFAELLAAGKINIIVVTSNESLRNLWELAGSAGQEMLKHMPLAVMSARIAATAQGLGVTSPVSVAPEANDDGLLAAIKAWRITQE